jgi:hypothetical protein
MKTKQERREEKREKAKRMKISGRRYDILTESQKKREEKYVKEHNFED